jgi:hypothetical protein
MISSMFRYVIGYVDGVNDGEIYGGGVCVKQQ